MWLRNTAVPHLEFKSAFVAFNALLAFADEKIYGAQRGDTTNILTTY
jgi:hypothetical protein